MSSARTIPLVSKDFRPSQEFLALFPSQRPATAEIHSEVGAATLDPVGLRGSADEPLSPPRTNADGSTPTYTPREAVLLQQKLGTGKKPRGNSVGCIAALPPRNVPRARLQYLTNRAGRSRAWPRPRRPAWADRIPRLPWSRRSLRIHHCRRRPTPPAPAPRARPTGVAGS